MRPTPHPHAQLKRITVQKVLTTAQAQKQEFHPRKVKIKVSAHSEK
jgi:hypothetical protein